METTEHRRDSVNTILSKQQFEEISDCLSKLAEKLQVTAVFLVDSAGRGIAQKVLKSWEGDSTLLSTLTASSYSATKEMARILGEQSNFKMVLHEGKHHNVYVSAVDGDHFLIVVFESRVALGMVRLFTKRTIAQLLPVLSEKGEGDFKMDQVFNQRFQSLLDEELDRSFKELS
jgi:predicted regulator of Ras-like GTPase activity (Roadblock/LC7/MglB family)